MDDETFCVIAWGREQWGPLAIDCAMDRQQMRALVQSFQEVYPYASCISVMREVFHVMLHDTGESVLPADGWYASYDS